MTNAELGLLSQADIDEIHSQGAPLEIRDELATLMAGNVFALTEKGVQYYTYAAHYWQVPLPSILSQDVLLEFHCSLEESILDSAESTLNESFRAGRIAPENRAWVAAWLDGNLSDVQSASRLTRTCRDAGSNVIALPQRKA